MQLGEHMGHEPGNLQQALSSKALQKLSSLTKQNKNKFWMSQIGKRLLKMKNSNLIS